MTADIVQLATIRRLRQVPDPGLPPLPEPAVDPTWELEAAQRSFLAVEEALSPWADSVLIAALSTTTGDDRERIIHELSRRAAR